MMRHWPGWHLPALAAALSLGQAAPPRVATGTVSGIVTDVRSQPIDRAIVTLSRGNRAESLTAITREDGKFEALDVPIGVYHVAVSKPGYAASWMGPTTVDPQGIPLDVDEKDRADLALQLRRGCVITGLVLDDAGDPVPNAIVLAEGPSLVNAPARSFADTVNADAHGRYRFFGLGAGEYVVSVMPGYSTQSVMVGNRLTRLQTTFWPGTTDRSARTVSVSEEAEASGIDIRLVRAPVAPLTIRFPGAEGRVDSTLVPVGESRNRQEKESGEYVLPAGQWILTALGNNRSTWAQETITTDGYSPAVRDIDLQPTASISGRIIVANGNNTGRRPFLWTTRVERIISYESSSTLIGPDATGAFALRGLTPGRYFLDFVDVRSPDRWIGVLRLGDREVIGPIAIGAGEQISEVTLTVGLAPAPSTIKGVVVDAPNQPDATHAVVLINEDERLWNESCRATPVTQPSTKGRFKFGDLLPGRYRLVTTELRRPDCADVQALRALVARGLAIELTAGQVREFSLTARIASRQ
jgi:hypothetical protein